MRTVTSRLCCAAVAVAVSQASRRPQSYPVPQCASSSLSPGVLPTSRAHSRRPSDADARPAVGDRQSPGAGSTSG